MSSDYSARHLSVLEGLEAVRKRPGMYIGSTDSRGLMHCLWEIIDNSVDEALGGHGTEIDIVLHADGSVEVRDRARGIPVDIEPKTGSRGVEVVFTKLHAGGKFGVRLVRRIRRAARRGRLGRERAVGATRRRGRPRRQDLGDVVPPRRARPVRRHGRAAPDAPFTPFELAQRAARSPARSRKGVTGTRVRYWADRQIFTQGAAFQLDELLGRARQTAFLVPGLAHRRQRRARRDAADDASFRFDGGISEFVEYLAPMRRSPTPGG